MWNVDKTGLRLGHHQSEQVVFNRGQGSSIASASSNAQWVTSLECISAAGVAITPLVIHQGKDALQPQESWFPPAEDCPNRWWGFSAKGWITNSYFVEWLTMIFDLETKQQGLDKTRALFIDGHRSHTTGTLQFEAHKRDILLIHLLSHSSHLIQPL